MQLLLYKLNTKMETARGHHSALSDQLNLSSLWSDDWWRRVMRRDGHDEAVGRGLDAHGPDAGHLLFRAITSGDTPVI